MEWLKHIWRDSVWSKVIAAVIVGAAATAWPPVRAWVLEDIRLSRSQVIAWFFLGVVLGACLMFGARTRAARNTSGNDAGRAPEQSVEAPPPARPVEVLEHADWNVLYTISQRYDPERVPRFHILALTGLSRLRADVALDRLKARNFIVANGKDKFGDQVYGLLPVGRIEALRLHGERIYAPSLPPDNPADMAPPAQRVLRWLKLHHAPGCWASLEELAAGARLPMDELEAVISRLEPGECFERSAEGIRLSVLGEGVFPDHETRDE